MALIGMGFAFAYSDLDFDAAIFPIHSQQWQGAAFDGGFCGKLEDFTLVQKKAPRAFRCVIEPISGGLPGLDITAVEKNLMTFDAGEGIGNIDFSGTDRFDLGAFEFQSSFVFVENMEIPTGLAVGGDFGTPRDGANKQWVISFRSPSACAQA